MIEVWLFLQCISTYSQTFYTFVYVGPPNLLTSMFIGKKKIRIHSIYLLTGLRKRMGTFVPNKKKEVSNES